MGRLIGLALCAVLMVGQAGCDGTYDLQLPDANDTADTSNPDNPDASNPDANGSAPDNPDTDNTGDSTGNDSDTDNGADNPDNTGDNTGGGATDNSGGDTDNSGDTSDDTNNSGDDNDTSSDNDDGSTTGGSGGSDDGIATTGGPPQAAQTTNTSFDTFANNGMFLSILPPGESDQGGTGRQQGVDPVAASPYFNDQLKKYRDLTFAPESLTTDQLAPKYYHREQFQPKSAFSGSLTTVSDADHTAQYATDDSTGTPHIYGGTRADVFFGIGYVNGLERLFLMDTLRHVGRGRLSDFIGPGNYAMDRSIGLFAGYSEREIHQQIDNLAADYETTGEQLIQDATDFIAGINEYIDQTANPANTNAQMPPEYAALQIVLRDFTIRDVLATAILIESRFGTGGGAEHKDARLLNGIGAQFGRNEAACGLWHDILQSDDPERPNTITQRFATQSPATVDTQACPFDAQFKSTYPGAVLFDAGSFKSRQLLTIENCVAPAVGTSAGAPATCPFYKQDPPVTKRFSDNSDGSDSSGGAASGSGGGTDILPDSGSASDPTGLLSFRQSNTHRQPPVAEFTHLLALVGATPATAGQPTPPVRATRPQPWVRLVQSQRRHHLQHARRRARRLVRGVAAYLNSTGDSGLPFSSTMSNALLVTADHTDNSRPLAVFGPQTGYFVPELELEFDAHGGGIDTRGMNFAGVPFVLIGRGKDFAWSATSASADLTDIRALKLCNPDDTNQAATRSSKGYMYRGQCKAFYQRTDEWTAETNANTADSDNQAVTRSILRAPDYGPVLGFASVNGQPIALAIQRSTFMHTLGAAPPFEFLNTNIVHDPKSFMKAFNLMNATFNWFYIDNDDIAYFMSGLLPKRADGIYPYLPQWGTGEYDWQQTQTGSIEQSFDLDNFLSITHHPRAVNPERGYLTSWNNAQAPGFYAADSKYSFGPVFRVDMLNARLLNFFDTGETLAPADLVTIMMDGGSTDLRAQEILPLALDILNKEDAEPALTRAEKIGVRLLSDWRNNGPGGIGAMRRDRDNSGEYDHRKAVVLMDSWFNLMINRALPQLVKLENTDQGNVMPLERDNHPNDNGSAYIAGYYGYLQRVLAMALDQSAHPYRQLQCADSGAFDACRDALLASLDQAIERLGGIDNRENWDGTQDNNGEHDPDSSSSDNVEKRDMISFRAIGLAGVQDILWQNRPTFQQVVSPTASRTAR